MRVKVTLTLQLPSRPSASQATLGGDEEEEGEDKEGDTIPPPGDFCSPRVQQLPEATSRSLLALFRGFSCGGERAGELPTLSRGCKGQLSRSAVQPI